MTYSTEIKTLESLIVKLQKRYDKQSLKQIMDVITDLKLTLRRLKEIV
jgi:hypothetical protein